MLQVITPENYKDAEIEKMALNPAFGSLTFSKSLPFLKKLQSLFTEFEKLNFSKKLPASISKTISKYKERFIDKLNWLNTFDISAISNAKDQHAGFQSETESLYNEVYQNTAQHLTFLRQELALESKDERNLQEEIAAASKARSEAEKILSQLEAKLEEINNEKRAVEVAQEQLGSRRLARHFEDEILRYEKMSSRWLRKRNWFYWSIFVLFILFILYYGYIGLKNIILQENIIWQVVLTKLALVSVLWYGVSFANKNYNVYSNLVAVNRHRAAAARTLEDFLGADQERQADVLKFATEAMFKHASIGFINKHEKESSNPVLEIVNKIINPGAGS